jgi:hypothetical protein
MAGKLPPVHRQIDLRRELSKLGVEIPGGPFPPARKIPTSWVAQR